MDTAQAARSKHQDHADAKQEAQLQHLTEAKSQLPPVDEEQLAIKGLSPEQVKQRQELGLTNNVPDDSSRTLGQILRGNLLTLFNIVLGSCFVILLLMGRYIDALFGVILIINAGIGVFQEYRAKRTLDELAVLNAPRARVLRHDASGQADTQELAVADVVYQDVLVLRTGDQIPADAVVLSSEGLESDESLLTGESDPIDKNPGDEVFSGAAVISGSGTVWVNRIGIESFASKLTAEAKRFSLVNSEIRNSINKIVRWITIALPFILVFVLNSQMQSRGGWGEAFKDGVWQDAVVSAIAAIVAMIPEGLVLLTSISFGLAAVTLARRQVLIQELPAVEGLARVDIVCLDKTGTLTEGEIIYDGLERLQTPKSSSSSGGSAATDESAINTVLSWIGADPNANATAACLKEVFTEPLPAVSYTIPFNSARKWSAASFCEEDLTGTWVLGAPEMVLDASKSEYQAALIAAAAQAETGLRALILAYSATELSADDAEAQQLPPGLVPVAVLTFREKVRPDAADTLNYFREQDVQLRVISGDNPRTVAAVAREVGFENVGQGYDARQLPEDLDELGEVLEREQVLGRVTPEQKKAIVLALQKRDHVVAMTGDGVNDALALKNADMGIAMGSGAQATKAVSRIVLLDGKFSRMPGVVAEGRRVIANVERVSSLFLTKTAYAIITAIVIGILLIRYPYLPRQLSVVSSLTIGIPAFFLALLPNKRRYQPGFLKRVLSFSLPAGLISAACLLGAYFMAIATPNPGLGEDMQIREEQSVATLTLLMVAFWVLVVLARPFDKWRVLIVSAMAVAIIGVFAIPFVRDFFLLVVPTGQRLWIMLIIAVVGCVAVEILYRVLKARGSVSERE